MAVSPSLFAMATDLEKIDGEELSAFLALIGETILSWSHVEWKIGNLYMVATGAHGVWVNPFHQSLVTSHYALVSFEARLAITSAAISETVNFDKAVIDPWSDLADRVGRKYKIRNNVAHSFLIGNGKAKRGRQLWLQTTPPIIGVRRGPKGKPPLRYHASDLKQFQKDFKAIGDEIVEFDRRLFRAMFPPESS